MTFSSVLNGFVCFLILFCFSLQWGSYSCYSDHNYSKTTKDQIFLHLLLWFTSNRYSRFKFDQISCKKSRKMFCHIPWIRVVCRWLLTFLFIYTVPAPQIEHWTMIVIPFIMKGITILHTLVQDSLHNVFSCHEIRNGQNWF